MAVKKSEFNSSSTVPAGSTFDYVTSTGTNIKIPVEDLLSALGVTGTLEQQGSVSGTPILNTAGTVNNIRNLEDGQGVKASVSPELGALLEHNFANGTVGAKLLVDNPDKSTTVKSLEAGSGINISVQSDHLEIEATGVVTALNTVIVNEMGDFPAAVAGVRTLADNTIYAVSADLTTGDRFVMGDNTVIDGFDELASSLTYTGADTFFTGADKNVRIKNITLNDSGSGTLFEFSNTAGNEGTAIVVFQNVLSNTFSTLGTCENLGIFGLVTCGFFDIGANGVSFSGGSSGKFEVLHSTFVQAVGTTFDLGTAVFDGVTITGVTATPAAGATFLSGAASSANISATTLGICAFINNDGLGDTLDTISADDARWSFTGNSDIPDTRPDGLLSLQNNLLQTTISVATTPVIINAVWVVEEVSQFTGTTGGRLTYDGVKDVKVPFTASISLEPVSGTNISMSAYFAKNGTVIANSRRRGTASSGSPTSITLPWQDTLSGGDYLEVYVANDDNTTNLVASSGIHRVN